MPFSCEWEQQGSSKAMSRTLVCSLVRAEMKWFICGSNGGYGIRVCELSGKSPDQSQKRMAEMMV